MSAMVIQDIRDKCIEYLKCCGVPDSLTNYDMHVIGSGCTRLARFGRLSNNANMTERLMPKLGCCSIEICTMPARDHTNLVAGNHTDK